MAEDHSTDSPRRTVPQQDALQSSALTPEEPLLPKKPRQWGDIWEGLLRLGLGEAAMRAGTVIASIALVLMVIWVMESFYLKGDVNYRRDAALAAPLPTGTPTIPPPPFERLPTGANLRKGIPRLALMYTILPTRPRLAMDFYEVKEGDTIIGIAERFGIKPQTILWGNFDTLADDPHRLQVGQSLRILPVDGVLYEWHAGDGLNGVATFFGVTPEDIVNYPSNNLTAEAVADPANPNIEPGTKLVIPGGERAFISWSAPLISRTDPAKAKIFGSGYCGEVYEGYVGGGTFVKPAPTMWVSGYDFTPGTNHWGIDIGGHLGDGIYAVDSGVIVYSGWNDWGYGNVLVIDHGNGWQSLYAHLNEIYVTCGASVSQGIQIGTMGSTGRSTGPHLHFELMDAGGNRVNPKNFVQ